jgi:outer membrane receptor protein involved in Fe transport
MDQESLRWLDSQLEPMTELLLSWSAVNSGSFYANVARSFKAPTLDQLHDRRATPVPFPPGSVTISNPELNPQRGTSMEVGAYHRLQSSSGLFAAELTLSAYRMDMTDELDFDLGSFRYVNVGESRHDGIEAGLRLDFGGLLAVTTNVTRQDVTARAGDFSGNQLKAIPRDAVSAGITAVHPAGLSGSLTLVRASGIFLDDANTIELPNYTTVDGRVAWGGFNGVSVFAEAFNLLDETFSSTGFPDPAGSDVVFYHPAAGRTVRIGAEVGW